MERLRTFPEHPHHVMIVILSGRHLEYWRTWRLRLGAWYSDIFEDDASPSPPLPDGAGSVAATKVKAE